MTPDRILALREWIAEASLAGAAETAMLKGVCERLIEEGVPLQRASTGLDTLHPVLEGRRFIWQRATGEAHAAEYTREQAASSEEKWTTSPFELLWRTKQTMLRRRIEGANSLDEFSILPDLAAEGATDYLVLRHPLGGHVAVGTTDAVYSSWTTDRAGGFTDDDIAAIDSVARALSIAIVTITTGRMAEMLVETYLGRDAGKRVLRGAIERGVAQPIRTVVWFSDLRGFTRIADTIEPAQLVPFLNDYAGAIVAAIHAQHGEVLKFIGDGILAIFAIDERTAEAACTAALDAAADAFARIEALNRTRAAAALPVTRPYIGLSIGEAFYGNIGSVDRLDFTVVGPAVNEASRIGGMCRSVDQDLLVSQDFAGAAGAAGSRLISVGRYALRGIKQPQELFTIDPGAAMPLVP